MRGKWWFPDSPVARDKLAESAIVLLVLLTAVAAYWFFRG